MPCVWRNNLDSEETPKAADYNAADYNAADYVDSLLRPKSPRTVVVQEKIKGRRLRDQYMDEVVVSKVVEE